MRTKCMVDTKAAHSNERQNYSDTWLELWGFPTVLAKLLGRLHCSLGPFSCSFPIHQLQAEDGHTSYISSRSLACFVLTWCLLHTNPNKSIFPLSIPSIFRYMQMTFMFPVSGWWYLCLLEGVESEKGNWERGFEISTSVLILGTDTGSHSGSKVDPIQKLGHQWQKWVIS